jgi:lipoate-protein ligase A
MHGECKLPGGKLVVIDAAAEEQVLTRVQLSGDFFLTPESATVTVLTALSAALVGQPTHLGIAGFAERVRAALPWDVELVGTTPEAIAVALQRALTGQGALSAAPLVDAPGSLTDAELERRLAPWRTANWCVIEEAALPPALNVALDEVLTEQVARSQREPTLRFWRWSAPAVVIGRGQSLSNEVDVAAAAAMGVTVVRRITGGGAMFLEPDGAVTYSLYLPSDFLKGMSFQQAYQVCDAWAVRALRLLGCQAAYAPINDITGPEGKIGGAAQTRRGAAVLHHTTLAYDMDLTKMLQVLRIGREKLSDKPGVVSAGKRVQPLARQTGCARAEVVAALLTHFQEHYATRIDRVTPAEQAAAEELVQSKYAQSHWTAELA